MEQDIQFFKDELKIILGAELGGTITENDEAVQEILKEAKRTKKAPNLRKYTNQQRLEKPAKEKPDIIPGFPFSPVERFEEEHRELELEFYKNNKNIDAKFYYYDIPNLSIIKALLQIQSWVNEYTSPETINNKFYSEENLQNKIKKTFATLPGHIQTATITWIKDTKSFEVLKIISQDLKRYKQPKKLFPDPKPFNPEKEQDENLKNIEAAKQIRETLARKLEAEFIIKEASPEYIGIASDLSPWIRGADDLTLEYIIKKWKLPEGKPKPIWITFKPGGEPIKPRWANAHRFRHFAGMTEERFNDCFEAEDKRPLKRGTAKGINLYDDKDTILTILKKYSKGKQ